MEKELLKKIEPLLNCTELQKNYVYYCNDNYLFFKSKQLYHNAGICLGQVEDGLKGLDDSLKNIKKSLPRKSSLLDFKTKEVLKKFESLEEYCKNSYGFLNLEKSQLTSNYTTEESDFFDELNKQLEDINKYVEDKIAEIKNSYNFELKENGEQASKKVLNEKYKELQSEIEWFLSYYKTRDKLDWGNYGTISGGYQTMRKYCSIVEKLQEYAQTLTPEYLLEIIKIGLGESKKSTNQSQPS